MLFNKQKVRDDDIAMPDRQPRLFQRLLVLRPFRAGMNRNIQARKLGRQTLGNPRGGSCYMAVHRHNHDAVAGDMITVTAHNGPLLHKAYRR